MTSRHIERQEVPPRENLLREAPFLIVRDAARDDAETGDGLTLDGYAAVFNRETIIDSWEGRFKEKISPGAMKKSFRESPPKIQFDHGRHALIGSMPIGQHEPGYPREEVDPARAPEGGAHVVARLHDNWLIQPLRDAIASASVDGMSFRFGVVREAWFDPTGKQIRDEDELRQLLRRTWVEDVPDDELLLRDLRELRVPELGPVVFPAYVDTSVGMRSNTITVDLGRLSDPDQRKSLARAVFLADAAERAAEEDEPQTTDEESAGEHQSEANPDTPRSTDEEPSAGEHESVHPQAEPAGLRSSLDRWTARKAVVVENAMNKKGTI